MRRDWRPLALVTQLGLTVVASLLLSLLLGIWLDGQLGTRPLFILLFSLIGVTAGIVGVYRLVSDAIATAAGPGEIARRQKSREADGEAQPTQGRRLSGDDDAERKADSGQSLDK